MNIPVKLLKEAVDIVAQPLTEIWKFEVVRGRKFSSKLKLADITPLHKKLETIRKEIRASQSATCSIKII